MNNELYPYVFEPVYRDYLWGGDRIARLYRRAHAPPVCAESWEIADRPEAVSVVREGPCRGRTLRELMEQHASDIIGADAGGDEVFPLLIKIIDARQRLSLQVHPDENTAVRTGGEPKSELWFVLQADPGARVYCGLRPGVDRATFENALRREQIEPLLHAVPAVSGEAVNVPGGRVHAIAEGCLLLEIQQNSNTTYRVYDWGRVDRDGRPRDVHVEQALNAINWQDAPGESRAPTPLDGPWLNRCQSVLTTPFSRVTRWDMTREETFPLDGQSFHAFFAVNGVATVRGNGQDALLRPGTTCLIPASLGSYAVIPETSEATLIRITRRSKNTK